MSEQAETQRGSFAILHPAQIPLHLCRHAVEQFQSLVFFCRQRVVRPLRCPQLCAETRHVFAGPRIQNPSRRRCGTWRAACRILPSWDFEHTLDDSSAPSVRFSKNLCYFSAKCYCKFAQTLGEIADKNCGGSRT